MTEARTACLTPEPSFDKSNFIAFYGAPKGAEKGFIVTRCQYYARRHRGSLLVLNLA